MIILSRLLFDTLNPPDSKVDMLGLKIIVSITMVTVTGSGWAKFHPRLVQFSDRMAIKGDIVVPELVQKCPDRKSGSRITPRSRK